MQKNYIISEQLVSAIINYLATRPWKDVQLIINEIRAMEKVETPSDEKE